MIEIVAFAVALAVLVAVTEWRLGKSLRALKQEIEAQSRASFKQQKTMIRRLEQSKRVADKVVADTAVLHEKVETVIKDPKVQRVLNRHEGV